MMPDTGCAPSLTCHHADSACQSPLSQARAQADKAAAAAAAARRAEAAKEAAKEAERQAAEEARRRAEAAKKEEEARRRFTSDPLQGLGFRVWGPLLCACILVTVVGLGIVNSLACSAWLW